ncbi:hypothetical protein [Neptuniibacter sp. QD37_11]|uniref:hypothetical protein n=1 Tax=Neptuniibacter sp. QD37_11 TaxID=3398209 RepID=UPI0039F49008
MQLREQRGTLSQSLATTIHIEPTKKALQAHIAAKMVAFGRPMPSQDDIRVEKYGEGEDSRCGWDTYLVSVEGYGVFGMIDGPLSEFNEHLPQAIIQNTEPFSFYVPKDKVSGELLHRCSAECPRFTRMRLDDPDHFDIVEYLAVPQTAESDTSEAEFMIYVPFKNTGEKVFYTHGLSYQQADSHIQWRRDQFGIVPFIVVKPSPQS